MLSTQKMLQLLVLRTHPRCTHRQRSARGQPSCQPPATHPPRTCSRRARDKELLLSPRRLWTLRLSVGCSVTAREQYYYFNDVLCMVSAEPPTVLQLLDAIYHQHKACEGYEWIVVTNADHEDAENTRYT
eukprot:2648228-Amphidinium_carterae.1